ncbi:MAG: hypothetical protein IT514_15230 [Burkholderiales bacterium]|nr:hypothetical protein [Burkholderiales bacterium]
MALAAPPKTPNDIVRRWNAEVNKVLHDGKSLGKLWSTTAMTPTGGSPEDLAAHIESKSRLGAELAKLANLKYD